MNDLYALFHGPNAAYVIELYERYCQDPESVDPETRALFEQWQPLPPEPAPPGGDGARGGVPLAPPAAPPDIHKIMGVVNLAQAIREFGHLDAQLDPLGSPPPGDPSLDPAYHGLREDDLHHLPATLVGGPCAEECTTAYEAIARLREVYCTTSGHDYEHVRVPEERTWLREAVESGRFRPPAEPINETALLERLTQVEAFERFLHRTFPGKTRFSIEGLDMMVPMLDEIVGMSVRQRIKAVLLGMAHRGRLNVLAHVLNKPYEQILAEFKDPIDVGTFTVREYLGWTGDVKYHAGANRCVAADSVDEDDAFEVDIVMAPNPSHLEHVNPVVEGMARAEGAFVMEPGPPSFDPLISLPILIHGDASFPGQGIVAETLNLSRLEGYHTGGTIHLIANNQLGFTEEPQEGRSTLYASDLAKGFKIPVIHVNADDPVACIEAARIASAYRHRFHKDVVIDLIGYRRHGHNEGDDPTFTQPVLYRRIQEHPTVRELWARHLVETGQVDPEHPDALLQQAMEHLQAIFDNLVAEEELPEPDLEPPPPGAAARVSTAVPLDTLREIHQAVLALPEGFHVHPRLERIRRRWVTALDDPDQATVDWTTAERLALATILAEGIPVRLTGEDVKRGTFSHRHAVLFDYETGEPYVPLHAFPQARASFEIHNSPLTEAATLGFEYGYNIQAPERLVIWEAQYGDFINVAQAIVDEFLVSGRAKWGQTPSLVLLLPHGYEGAGPDHSSARPERFLQLAAETNMRIVYPTTAAQYFHLLRRQAKLLRTDPLPLIVLSPKSLLRHWIAMSTPRELAEGRWHPVIDDPNAVDRRDEIRRLVLCSGKIAADLESSERRNEHPEIGIVRLEQLYPFPEAALGEVLDGYPHLTEVVWCQEEPSNMGAWSYVEPLLVSLLGDRLPLRYVGRPRRASPAEGSAAWHTVNQQAIVEQVFAW